MMRSPPSVGSGRIKRLGLSFIITFIFILQTGFVYAACSPYVGMANLNEFFKNKTNQDYDANDFVEIKILNSALTSSTFNNWTLQVCERYFNGNLNDNDNCSTVSLNSFTNQVPPWLLLKGNIGRFVNFKTGFNAILRDSSGDVIDYLSVDNFTSLQDASCTGAALGFDYQASAPGASDKFIFRSPDGTGNWDSTSSASALPTEDNTNDTDPSGNPWVTVNVSNITVTKGQTATFTFTLTGGAVGYNVSVNYQTQNGTAIAGTDYTTTSGTATILAGGTSATVNVPTTASSLSGQVYFYLYLSNPVQATVTNNYPSATILDNALASWYMEQGSWSGTANEVTDSSGNNHHATAINGANTNGTTPAIAGSPGTCSNAKFDGSNDYISLNGFPNLTGSFTITAWIRADRIDKDQRIFADDENNSSGYAFSLGDGGSGKLRFFSRQISPISLDSNAVITAGTWYHVAAVHDVINKTRQIFVNGVAATSAQTYTGTWGADTGTATMGGESNNAGSEASSNWRFDGLIDEVNVYSSALNSTAITTVMNLTHPCSTGVHHFEITHDGTGLTCEPETVTLKACTDASCSSTSTTDVSVTLSPTGWSGGDTHIISGVTGSGTFQLSKTSAATYTLGVISSSPSATNTVQCINTGAANSSCDLTYFDTGFIYDVPNLTSCATSANVTVSAVRLDATTQACVPTFQNQTKTINFWSSYSSPATGTKQVIINNGSADKTIATSSPGTNVDLSFNNSGQATMTVTYDDAGQLNLSSRYNNGALTMLGSDSFIAVPAKLSVYSDDVNADCATNNANCSAFTSAGSNFNLKVRAACANNNVTPNFILNTITLTHTNTAPAVAQGNLSVASFDMLDSDDGEHTLSQAVSEVGVFTFTATAPAYFGATGPGGTSPYIGRFTPDHFCVSSGNILNRTDANSKASCTDNFSYLSEDFTNTFTLTAQKNSANCGDGTNTANYTSSFSKFDTSALLSGDNTSDATETGALNFAALDSTSTTDLSSRINFNTATSTSSGEFVSGNLAVTAKLDITRAGSAPTYTAETAFTNVNIGIKPIDTDNVSLDTTNLTISGANYFATGNTALYFGRLYADSTFGAEQEGLPMWAEPQYCNAQGAGVCSDWQTKADDTCSLFTVSAPADTVVGATSAGANGYWVSGVDYSASSGTSYTIDSNNHKAGWRVWYTAVGTGGTYTIPFVTHPYLLTQDGSASFGLYRGDDRIIYWQEIFN